VDAAGRRAAVTIVWPAAAIVLVEFASEGPRIVRRIMLPPGTIPGSARFTGDGILVAARGQGVLVLAR
jgi:hypothetical protein